ncbi:MAG: hypothetical protein AB7F32_02040 [Victivallaceae bacterium]
MKIVTVLLSALLGLSLAAGEPLWNGESSSIALVSKLAKQQVDVSDGTLTVSAEGNNYLIFNIAVKPFSFAKQALSLELKTAGPRGFYVKGLTADGKIAASFYTLNAPRTATAVVLAPEAPAKGFLILTKDLTAPVDTPVVKLQIFLGRSNESAPMSVSLAKIETVALPPPPVVAEVRDYGVAASGGTNRGTLSTRDGEGRDVAVVWLMDKANDRILQIDAATGKTDAVELPYKPGDSVYSSILSQAGKCYSHFGGYFVEYDPAVKKYTAWFKTPHQAAMSMCEDAKGVIWAAIYPDGGLVSYDPASKKFTDYGAVNRENWAQYPRSVIAGPDGWLYIGIGSTNGQIVAFNPATRQAVPLLAGDERPNPSSYDVSFYSDGKIYGRHQDRWYQLENGGKTKLDKAPDATIAKSPVTGTQGLFHRNLPSGKVIREINLLDGVMTVEDPKTKELAEVKFQFKNRGAPLMALDANAEGVVAGGSFFPFRISTLNPQTGAKTEEAAGIQCNTILAHGKYFYIGGYHGGQILRYDPSKPWTLKNAMGLTEPDLTSNPVYYGKASPVIARPHGIAITPDGKTLAVGGTPAYGVTGGGLALLDTESGKLDVIPNAELAPDEAPQALAWLDNQTLLIGTTTAPGTGGERKAKECSLLLFDLKTKKVTWRGKELGAVDAIYNLLVLPDGKILGAAAPQELFLFDPATRQIVRRGSFADYGAAALTQGPRVLLSDGKKVYLVLRQGIATVDPAECKITEFRSVPGSIEAGGAIVKGSLFFNSDNRWQSVRLDGENR